MRSTLIYLDLVPLFGGCGAVDKASGQLRGKPHDDNSSDAIVAAPPVAAPTFACKRTKTPAEFVTTLTQDLYRRGPTADD